MHPQDINLKTSQYRLGGIRWGKPGKTPVIALHGWLDNAASFSRLAPLLNEIDLIALDLPGHGFSEHFPSTEPYKVMSLLPILVEAMQALGWDKAVWMGHSLGGVIASLLASMHPQIVAKLIFIDAVGPISQELSESPGPLEDTLLNIRKISSTSPKIYPTLESAINARQKAGGLTEIAARTLVTRGIQQTSKGYTWRFDPKLLIPTAHYMTEKEIHALLRKIVAPTFCIEAESGLLMQHPIVQERIQQFSNIEHVILPGSHHLHLENPGPVAEAINYFLSR